jgi:glycosyltransferase involved in cell wall biosynthesis
MKIGIGITTRNRKDVFDKTFWDMMNFSPLEAKFAVVDDASETPLIKGDYFPYGSQHEMYRFDTNVGIAAAKNKCFELLDDCDHIFLLDDDTYAISHNWWKPYVESPEPHLMYIFKQYPPSYKGPQLNDTVKLYEDDKIIAYTHPRGCMLYFDRKCLELVGGMDTIFGKACHEHPDLSNRIYNAGLTRFRFMDVPGSDKLFYSGDEHKTVQTTWTGRDRLNQIQRNTPIYEKRYSQKIFFPYKEGQKPSFNITTGLKRNEVLTCYFTGVPDPQGVKREGNILECEKLTHTVFKRAHISVSIFNDFMPCDTHEFRHSIATINPYWQRWVTYREYLIKNRDRLGFVWCVDATDVEMLRDPFPHMGRGTLFVGDEPGNIGGNIWLTKHHKHPMLQHFFRNNRSTLLNAGLVGGDVETMIEFTGHMIDVYQQCEHHAQIKGWPNAGMTDMGALNYVVYTHFKGRFSHGKHVNTKFKGYEADNGVSWYRHK